MRGAVHMKKQKRSESWSTVVTKDFWRNKSLYLMILPVIVYFICFHYIPMYGAIIAFKDFKPQIGIMGSPWVGLEHFRKFFTNPSFTEILWNTLRISLSTLVFEFPAPIILALLINEIKSTKFAKLVQNATYLPHFISLVVICGLIRDFTMDTGIISTMMAFFGFERKSLLNYPEYFTPIYVVSDIWQQMGWDSIVYLAALTSVDPQLYESADLDGANGWKKALHITLPGIMPTVATMLILRVGSLLNVGFEKIILLYNNATLSVADVISTYVYRKGLIDLDWSYSAATGLFNSVINFIFLITMNKISTKVNDVGLW